jgi:hypothetical protein
MVSSIAPLPSPPAQPVPTILRGTQLVRKFNRTTADEVRILVALFRVDGKASDIVLSVNIPASSNGDDSATFVQTSLAFHKVVQTFKILDFGLFA